MRLFFPGACCIGRVARCIAVGVFLWCCFASAICFSVYVSVCVAVGVLQWVCCSGVAGRYLHIYICVWREEGERVCLRESARARERCVAGVLQWVLQWVLLWCCSAIFLWCCSEIPLFAIVVCGSVCCSVCRVQCVQCVEGREGGERERRVKRVLWCLCGWSSPFVSSDQNRFLFPGNTRSLGDAVSGA